MTMIEDDLTEVDPVAMRKLLLLAALGAATAVSKKHGKAFIPSAAQLAEAQEAALDEDVISLQRALTDLTIGDV